MAGKEDLVKVAAKRLIHIMTTGRRTGRPHMVEAWFAVRDGKVYLSHEGEETDWMKNIRKNSQVSFKIGGEHFAGRARYLEEGTDEAWTGKVALYEKYYSETSRDVIEDWFSLSRLLVIEL